MAKTAALGNGPVVFFTTAGQQVSVPLSAIFFQGDNVGAYPPYDAAPYTPRLTTWLRYLARQRRLVADVTPAPLTAAVVTAAATGSAGNNIKVEVVPNAIDESQYDVTVTEQDEYPLLTLGTLLEVLGDGSNSHLGSRPGLVRINQPFDPSGPLPKEGPAGSPTTPTTPPSWEIKAATGTSISFTLEASRQGTDVTFMKVSVSDVKQDGTFTLTARWRKSVTVPAAAASFTSLSSAFAFAVTFTPPPGPGGFRLPAPGTVSLGGGAEAVKAVQAKATLLAGP